MGGHGGNQFVIGRYFRQVQFFKDSFAAAYQFKRRDLKCDQCCSELSVRWWILEVFDLNRVDTPFLQQAKRYS